MGAAGPRGSAISRTAPATASLTLFALLRMGAYWLVFEGQGLWGSLEFLLVEWIFCYLRGGFCVTGEVNFLLLAGLIFCYWRGGFSVTGAVDFLLLVRWIFCCIFNNYT